MTTRLMDRREFTGALTFGLGAALTLPVWAQGRKNLRIGHTGITWPGGALPPAGGRAPGGPPTASAPTASAPTASAPTASVQGRAGVDPGLAPPLATIRPVNADAIEQIFKDVSSLGFHGLELFNWQIEGMEANGGLGPFIERYRLPLISSYSSTNLTDPTQRTTSIERLVAGAKVVRKYGGKVIVVGPNSVSRSGYVFAEHKTDIIATLNEGARAIADLGLTAVLHQHTGTCIETRDETYAVMEAVDTRYLKFGPDIGQLQKGGSDPVQVVRDFLPLIHHMHMKDYNGGDAFAGYCPLGQGKVDLAAVLTLMDGRPMSGMIMVELDSSANMPMTPVETARIAKGYLEKQGVPFRSGAA